MVSLPQVARAGRGVVLTTLALFVAAGAAPAAERGRGAPTATVFETLRPSLVQVGLATPRGAVMAVTWLGTGSLVDRDCHVLTAAHLLADVPEESVVVRVERPGSGGETLTLAARVVHRDGRRDLALLRFGEGPGGVVDCAAAGLVVAPLAAEFDRERLTGEDIVIAGFPVLERERPREVPIVRRGIVASSELEWDGLPMLLLDLTGIPGFSGAPVVRVATGEVIGVVLGRGRTEREYDLEWAAPVTRNDIKQALAAAGAQR